MPRNNDRDQFACLDDPYPVPVHIRPNAVPHPPVQPQLMARSRLIISEDMRLVLSSPMPNRWYRFWARVLLGFRWEPLP